ncbi:MAG: M3 family oligoendopeptidase [Alphaproteobacteria bacterium]
MLDHNLPTWDLTDLYDSAEDPKIKLDISLLSSKARAFAESYENKVAKLNGTNLGFAIAELEEISELAGRISSFAFLHFAGQVTDPERGRFRQSLNEQMTEALEPTLFFTLELQSMEVDDLDAKLKDPEASKYASWIDTNIRPFAAYRLAKDLETYIAQESSTTRAGFVRLFDETMAALVVEVRGERLSLEQALNNLQSSDRSLREESGKTIANALAERSSTLTLITNTLAKAKEIEDRTRGHKSPMETMNLHNAVEDEVVDALVTAVSSSYQRLAHRYYKMKASWLGLESLRYWDRNAPLPGADSGEIPYSEAVDTVRKAYEKFSPKLAEVAAPFFENAWIDVPARPGKAPGAFAHPTVPSAHPYLMLNYQGKVRDVMTLAHELGHGVHQRLASNQGLFKSSTPLTLAETASVFGEMLTFRALLDRDQPDEQRKRLIAGKVEDMLNTVVRQISFHEFEWAVHQARKTGELSTDQLNKIWLDIAKNSLGPVFDFDDDYGAFWSYIPHFIHSPFYVYAYAFGDCLVNALYQEYETNPDGFEDKYLELLSAGGSQRHSELLAPFNLDATDPDFWSKGLDFISGLIDELEAL